MNYSDYRFTLDVQVHQAQVSVPVMLGDTARRLFISLSDGRKPYYIADGCRAVLVAQKPDGTSIFNDCIIENNSTIVYQFTPNTTSAEGIVNCEVRLYGENRLITSAKFIIVVDAKVIRDEEILSESEHTTLDNIIMSEKSRVAAEVARVDAEAERKRRFDSGELNGEDGYTPVRGKDYWTPEDVAAINEDIDKRVDEKSSMIGGFIPVTAPVWHSGAQLNATLVTVTGVFDNGDSHIVAFNQKEEQFEDGNFEYYSPGEMLVEVGSRTKGPYGWTGLSYYSSSGRYADIRMDEDGNKYVAVKSRWSSLCKSLKLKPYTDYTLSFRCKGVAGTHFQTIRVLGKAEDGDVYYKSVSGALIADEKAPAYDLLKKATHQALNFSLKKTDVWQTFSLKFTTTGKEYVDICIAFEATTTEFCFDDFSVLEDLGEEFAAIYSNGRVIPSVVDVGSVFYIESVGDSITRFEYASSLAIANIYKNLLRKIETAMLAAIAEEVNTNEDTTV